MGQYPGSRQRNLKRRFATYVKFAVSRVVQKRGFTPGGDELRQPTAGWVGTS
jgi:hypothetical protein